MRLVLSPYLKTTAGGMMASVVRVGGVRRLCPGISDIVFFCDFTRLVDLDAKIMESTLDPSGWAAH
jgi:hypothetical protein